MSAPEGMIDVLHREVDFFYFARCEGIWRFKAVPELSSERLSPHQLLIPAHGEGRHRDIFARLVAVFWTSSILHAIWKVRWIHVDQLYVKVRIRSTGRNEQAWRYRPRNRHIFLEHGRPISEHIGAFVREPLIREHVLLRHIECGVAHKRHGFSRIAYILIERRA